MGGEGLWEISWHGGCRCSSDGRIWKGIYSRSYAEDVTSVTSGASQGPHSLNSVFVCVFVCLFVSRLALSVSDGKKA